MIIIATEIDLNKIHYFPTIASYIANKSKIASGDIPVINANVLEDLNKRLTNVENNYNAIEKTYSYQKDMTLTTEWQDTGIYGSNLLPSDGVYIVEAKSMSTANQNTFWGEAYVGVMSWYVSGTNSENACEIPLHNCGHADNAGDIYLRTLRHRNSNNIPYVTLQIKANNTYVMPVLFKFKRLMTTS